MLCGCCGLPIEGVPTDWGQGLPREIFEMTAPERMQRARVGCGGDMASLAGNETGTFLGSTRRYFLRGILYLPIRKSDIRFGLGLWAEITDTVLEEIVGVWDKSGADETRRWPGKLNATPVPFYPELDGLEVEIALDISPTRRPHLIAPPGSQARTDQDAGIDVETWHRYSSLMAKGG